MHAALIHLAAEFQLWNESSARADHRGHSDIARNAKCGGTGKFTQRSLSAAIVAYQKRIVVTLKLLDRRGSVPGRRPSMWAVGGGIVTLIVEAGQIHEPCQNHNGGDGGHSHPTYPFHCIISHQVRFLGRIMVAPTRKMLSRFADLGNFWSGSSRSRKAACMKP